MMRVSHGLGSGPRVGPGFGPDMALTDDQQRLLDSANRDLVFLFDREDIPVNVQLQIYESGLTTLARWASVAKDQDDFRAFLAVLGVDPGASLQARVLATKLTVTWRAATARADRRAEAEAEAEVSSTRKPLPPSEAQNLKSAWEA